MLKSFCLIFSFFVFLGSASANQRIEIREGMVKKAGNIYFDDIAVLEGFTESSKKHLSSLLVAADLKEGEIRKISDLALTDLIRRSLSYVKSIEIKAGKNFNLVLKMPKVLELYLNSPKWSEKKVSDLLIRNNQELCMDCSFEITDLRMPKADSKKAVHWDLEIPNKMIKGNFQIPLKITRIGKEHPETYYVAGNMKTYKELPVARRNISPGERILDTDVIFEKREMNFVRKDIPTKDEIIGAKAKRMALSGSILWLSNLEKEKAVERGELVELIVRKNNIEMRMKGVAQQAGFVGDRVSVLNRNSKKVISGKIVSKSEVLIQ